MSTEPLVPTPTVGRMVHYVSRGSLDGRFPPTCRMAWVTEVAAEVSGGPAGIVGLCVVNPTGLFFHALADGGCGHDDTPMMGPPDVRPVGGSWHWPERA